MINKFNTEVHNIHNALLLSDIQLISEVGGSYLIISTSGEES